MTLYRVTFAVAESELPETVRLLTSLVESGTLSTQFLIERDPDAPKRFAAPEAPPVRAKRAYKRSARRPDGKHRVEILRELIVEKGGATWNEMRDALVANGLKATSINSTFGELRKRVELRQVADRRWVLADRAERP